jgi:hypothetical protein
MHCFSIVPERLLKTREEIPFALEASRMIMKANKMTIRFIFTPLVKENVVTIKEKGSST